MTAVTPLVIAEDLLILGAMSLLGALAVSVVLRRVDGLAIASVGPAPGMGLLTFSLFLLSWGGVSLNLITVVATYSSLVLAFLFIFVTTPRRTGQADIARNNKVTMTALSRWLARVAWGMVLLLWLTSTVLAVGMSHYTWDPIAAWVVKGYGIALEGSVYAGAN
ncbi:MAG: hypothetical protein AB1449_13175 [Chloroflexota bacterium]